MTNDDYLAHFLRNRLEQSPPRRVEPSVSLLNPRFRYVNRDHTDIRVTFERARQQLKESKQ